MEKRRFKTIYIWLIDKYNDTTTCMYIHSGLCIKISILVDGNEVKQTFHSNDSC